MAGPQHSKLTVQQCSRPFDQIQDCARQGLPRSGGIPDEDDTGRTAAGGKHELSEVFVLGQEDPILLNGHTDNLRVLGSRQDLHNRNDIMIGLPQRPNDGEVATLVRQGNACVSALPCYGAS